jgi:hypothetical protein
MKSIIQIFILTIVSVQVYGQASAKDLNGRWVFNNSSESYYTADTIKLFQYITFQFDENTSKLVVWKKERSKLSIDFINNFVLPSSILNFSVKRSIKIKRRNKTQFIEIREGRKITELFRILSLDQQRGDENYDNNKILTLERIKNEEQISKADNIHESEPPYWYLGYLFLFF